MVTIRLARGGAKKRPFYHLTVTDSRKSRDGRFIERLGFFNPVARGQEERLRVDLSASPTGRARVPSSPTASPSWSRKPASRPEPDAAAATVQGSSMSEHAQAQPADDHVVLGKLTSPYGVKGWLKVYSYTSPMDGILDYEAWVLRRGGRLTRARLLQGRRHGKGLVARLEGIDGREAAEAWRVPRSCCPRPNCPSSMPTTTTGISSRGSPW